MKEETFTITRTGEDGKTTTLMFRVRAKGHTLEIRPEGYGEKNAADGEGSPVWLELGRDGLNLFAADDINYEGPSDAVDLEPAREDNRWKWGIESRDKRGTWHKEAFGYAAKERAELVAGRLQEDPRLAEMEFRVVPLDD